MPLKKTRTLIMQGVIKRKPKKRKKPKQVKRINPKLYRMQRRKNFLAKASNVFKGVLSQEKSRQWNSEAKIIEKLARQGKIDDKTMRKLFNSLDAFVLGKKLGFADKKLAIKYGLPIKI